MKITPEALTKYDYCIKWRLTYKCNYKCEYCIQSRTNNRTRRTELPYDVMRVAGKIGDMIIPGKKTLVELVGGDISVVKEIPEIVALFKSKGAVVKALTNLSRDVEFYKDFTQIRASYHASQVDFGTFTSKVLKLKEMGVDMRCEAVVSDKSSEEDNRNKFRLNEWCESRNIQMTIDVDRVYDSGNREDVLNRTPLKSGSYVYVDGVKTAKNQLLGANFHSMRTKGMKCFLGVNSIDVLLDKINVCTPHKNNDFKWYDEPFVCPYDTSACIRCANIMFEKDE